MRILLTATAVALALPMLLPPPATADLAIHIEDFEHNGEPGFDPLFNHEFSADPGEEPSWRVAWSTQAGHLSECMLFLANGTTDTITFNLPPSQLVIYASVAFEWGPSSGTSIRFVGTDNTWEPGIEDLEAELVEVTASQVGTIEQIELYSRQGIFWNVTIGVIPEPDTTVLFFTLAVTGCTFVALRRRP